MVSPSPLIHVGVSKSDNFDCARRRIIEVDGVDVEPYTVDNFPISVAQRYSVLVTAKNVTDQNFILHANFDPQMFDAVPDDLQLSASHSFPSCNLVRKLTFIPLGRLHRYNLVRFRQPRR